MRISTELVQEWRGSLRSRPPALTQNDEYWPGRDRKYADLSMDEIPLTESLFDCMERTCPLWEKKIRYELQRGRNVLVVAHANTLRGLVKTIDNIGDAEIQGKQQIDCFRNNFKKREILILLHSQYRRCHSHWNSSHLQV